MSWTVPWTSSAGSDFNDDFGLTTDDGETFGLSVFMRDGDNVFRTYFTAGRRVEALGSTWTFLDLTPLAGRRPGRTGPRVGRRRRPMSGGVATTNMAMTRQVDSGLENPAVGRLAPPFGRSFESRGGRRLPVTFVQDPSSRRSICCFA
jgi:hypothetical protein